MHAYTPSQYGQASLYLPNQSQAQLVNFEVINGMAVMEGDMLLGPPNQLLQLYGTPPRTNTYGAVAITGETYRWPNGDVPYEFAANVTQNTASGVQWASEQLAQVGIRLRPRTTEDRDYLSFNEDQYGCFAFVGRRGGRQGVNVKGCSRGNILHEVMHSIGFYHEQSRSDRDQYITIVWEEIEDAERSNFEKRTDVSDDIDQYDYASVMHYGPTAFSKSGRPTIIPKVAGAPIGQRESLSQLDRAAITKLYSGDLGGTLPGGFPGIPGLPAIPGMPTTIPGLPAIPGWPSAPAPTTTNTTAPPPAAWVGPWGSVPVPAIPGVPQLPF